MARNYQQNTFDGSSYRGSIQGGSYDPIVAQDSTKRINQETDKKIKDIQTLQRSAARQGQVDAAQMAADHARQNANFAAIKGLINLSGTLAKEFQANKEKQEAQQLRDQEEAMIFGELEEITEPETEPNTTNEAIQASEIAIQEVGGDDEELKDSLRAEQGEVIKDIQIKKIGVYEASQNMDVFMQEFQFSTEEIITPDGRTITPATIDNQTDKNFVLKYAFSKFAKENGLAGMDKEARQRVLMPKARQLMQNFSSSWGANITNARKADLLEKAAKTADTGLDSNEDLKTVYQDLTTNLLGSGNYQGKGLGKAANDAFDYLVAKAVETGDRDLLEAIGNMEKVEGNSGTTFNKIKKTELKAALDKLVAKERSDYKTLDASRKVAIAKIGDTRIEALTQEGADDAVINQTAITQLEAIGSTAALKEANKLKNLGLNYNPKTAQQMLDSGKNYSEGELIELVRNQDITLKEAKLLGFTGTGASKSDVANDKFKSLGFDKSIKNTIKSIISGVAANEVTTSDEQKLFLDQFAPDIVNDATRRMEQEMKQWIMDNPDENPYIYSNELKARYKDELGSLSLNEETGTIDGYRFGGVPTIQIGDTKHLNFGSLSFEELKDRGNISGYLNPNEDILLSPKQMDTLKFVGLNKQGLATLSKPMMKRVELLEQATGTGIEQIYRGQLGMYGISEKVKETVLDTEINEELSTKYMNSELSEASTRALGYRLTKRQLNNPNNIEDRNKIISYLENN